MTNIIPLPFTGDLIEHLTFKGAALTLLWRDGEAYVAIRPICERLSLSWSPQHRKLTNGKNVFSRHLTMTAGVPIVTKLKVSDQVGRGQEMLVLHTAYFALWIAGISASRVKPEVREVLIAFQDECALVLYSYVRDRLFGELAEHSHALHRLRLDLLARKPSLVRIVRGVEMGWDFRTIWRAGSMSRPKLTSAIKDCLHLGLIEQAPDGTPFAPPQGDLFPVSARA